MGILALIFLCVGSVMATPIDITVNTTINTNTTYNDVVRVHNGATLTITGCEVIFKENLDILPGGKTEADYATLKFGAGKGISVQSDYTNLSTSTPGGILIADNSLFTEEAPSTWSTTWYGIEVWGMGKTQSQNSAFARATFTNCDLTVLNAISSNFTLTEEEDDAITGLIAIYELNKSLYDNNDDWTLVDDNLKLPLFDIATEGHGYAMHMARSILQTYYEDITFDPIYIFTDDGEARNSTSIKILSPNNSQIYPNPAKEHLTIKLDAEIKNKAQVQITDLLGRTIYQKEIITGLNTIDISMVPTGNYIVKLIVDNKNLKAQKLSKL